MLEEIAASHGATARQVVLRFLVRRPSLLAIPKATSAEHAADNAAAGALRLTDAELARIDAALDAAKTRLERVGLDRARPALGQPGPREDGAAQEHKAAFDLYVRAGESAGLKRLEAKALSAGSGPDGGYLVPQTIERTVLARLAQVSPIRSIAIYSRRLAAVSASARAASASRAASACARSSIVLASANAASRCARASVSIVSACRRSCAASSSSARTCTPRLRSPS